MLKIFCYLVILVTLFPAAGTYADNEPLGVLERIFRVFRQPVEESIHFVRVRDGRTLYAKNKRKSLSPASVSKLVTAAAALDRLTPAFRFTTNFYYTGALRDGVIHGDLFVKGDGDPFIVSEKLWQLAVDLRLRGIKQVQGHLVIDNSLFDNDFRDASRQSGERASQNAYDAPVSAFGVNFNTFAVAVAPADRSGAPAVANIDPYPLDAINLINRVTTSEGRQRINASRTTNDSGSAIMLAGEIPAGAGLAKIYRSVGDPVEASGATLRSFLLAEGIAVSGQVRSGRVPLNAQLLFELKSYEMNRIVSGLNKWSNNFIADMLVKRLGAQHPRSGPPLAPHSGSFENGVRVLNEFMSQTVGVSDPFVLKNGSGLSTENRLSARQVTQLLIYMSKRLDLFPEFLASLPASGWDGTLRDRFDAETADAIKGQVRAKTGTLTNPISVVSLGGYLQHPEHGLVAFAIIENGRRGSQQPNVLDLRARQDHALTEFIRR